MADLHRRMTRLAYALTHLQLTAAAAYRLCSHSHGKDGQAAASSTQHHGAVTSREQPQGRWSRPPGVEPAGVGVLSLDRSRPALNAADRSVLVPAAAVKVCRRDGAAPMCGKFPSPANQSVSGACIARRAFQPDLPLRDVGSGPS